MKIKIGFDVYSNLFYISDEVNESTIEVEVEEEEFADIKEAIDNFMKAQKRLSEIYLDNIKK